MKTERGLLADYQPQLERNQVFIVISAVTLFVKFNFTSKPNSLGTSSSRL